MVVVPTAVGYVGLFLGTGQFHVRFNGVLYGFFAQTQRTPQEHCIQAHSMETQANQDSTHKTLSSTSCQKAPGIQRSLVEVGCA